MSDSSTGSSPVVLSSIIDKKGFEPIRQFTGELDGQNYTIEGLSINRVDENNVGLISTSQGEIKNIKLNNINIKGNDHVGGLVGLNSNGMKIINSSTSGKIVGTDNIGGLVGLNHNHAEIHKSYSKVNIKGDTNIGGIIGKNNNHAEIYSVYSLGSLIGDNNIGGIIGKNKKHGHIYTSYAAGNITGNDNVGGIVGNKNGYVTNSYWDVNSTGQKEQKSEIGIGLTTEDMKGKKPLPKEKGGNNTMNGFNFDSVWKSVDSDYPILRGQ